jgi:hypothetical protein
LSSEKPKRSALPSTAKDPFGEGLLEGSLEEGQREERRRQYLRNLALVKKQYTEMALAGSGHASLLQNMSAQKSKLRLEAPTRPLDPPGITDPSKPTSSPRREHVTGFPLGTWIEWNEVRLDGVGMPNPGRPGTDPFASIEDRLCLLASLLKDQLSDGFHPPRVDGYVRKGDPDTIPRFGIVIRDARHPESRHEIFTLHEILSSNSEPSLSQRISLCVTLAESLHTLHAVNWLHKGIRSDNIIYFASSLSEVEVASPLVSGYELSRPEDINKMTQKPAPDPQKDMYRHPEVQSWTVGRGYHKSDDMYSLGIVFIEVAYWKPIETVLSFDDPSKLDSVARASIKNRLLGEDGTKAPDDDSAARASEFLRCVGARMGDAYQDIVELCLRADEIARPMHRGESETLASVRLHKVMEQSVVRKLKEMERIMMRVGDGV